MRAGLVLLCAVSAGAQPAPQGLTTEWEIGKVFQAISAHAKRLLPMVEQIDPKPWIAKGAPEAYLTQLNSAKTQAKAVADSAQTLAQAPGKLSAAIELTYRIQSLETALVSLADGMRRYHNPAMAELLVGVVMENGANRDHLQQYVVDLAADKEVECAVADKEAQRCRGFLSRQTPAPPPPQPRTKKK
jgi:hypothetical protein